MKKIQTFSTAYVVIKDNKMVMWDSNMLALHKKLSEVTTISYTYLTIKLRKADIVVWDDYKIYKLQRSKEKTDPIPE